MSLFAGEKVYNASNIAELVGNGKSVFAGGELRLLSRVPPRMDQNANGFSRPFEDRFKLYPRSEWSDRLKTQIEHQGLNSDAQNYPPHDQNGLPTCFPAGTMIRMADGSEKRIEDVRVLDEVVTAEGNVGRVMNTQAHWVEELLYTPVMWGHYHLKATGEHPILTKRGYVPVKELQPGDKVAFPKYAAQTSLWLATADHISERFKVRQSKRVQFSTRGIVSAGKPLRTYAVHQVPDIIHLDYSFGRVVGFFLAEGNTSPGCVLWSFNATERDTFASEVVERIAETTGADASIRMRTAGHVAQVQLHGVRWAKLFESLCSTGAGNKRLHPSLCAGPLPFLRGTLDGWMDGDRQRGTSAVSISRELALNMFDVANAESLMPILSTHQRSHHRAGMFHQHAWKVGWGDKGKPNHGTEQDATHLWRKIRRVDSQPFKGYVYNIGVEGDHSYVTEGVGVHNCWANGPAGCMTFARVRQGLPYKQISACSVAVPISGGHSGGWEGDALEYYAKHGGCGVDVWPNNATDRSLMRDPKVEADRLHHKALEWLDCGSNFDCYATACLMGFSCAVAYSWWSHVVMVVDLVEISSGKWGLRIRNNWGKWGAANRHGFYGYQVLEEGHGTPGSGFALCQVTASII